MSLSMVPSATRVAIASKLPPRYDFLDPKREVIEDFRGKGENFADCDCVVVLDTGAVKPGALALAIGAREGWTAEVGYGDYDTREASLNGGLTFGRSELDLGVRCAELRTKTVHLEYGLFLAGTDTLMASGESVSVWADLEIPASVPLPDDIRQALTDYEAKLAAAL